MKELVNLEEEIISFGKKIPDDVLGKAKLAGFADSYISEFSGLSEKEIREQRIKMGMIERWEPLPVSGVPHAAYYYSTYAPEKKTNTDMDKRLEEYFKLPESSARQLKGMKEIDVDFLEDHQIRIGRSEKPRNPINGYFKPS